MLIFFNSVWTQTKVCQQNSFQIYLITYKGLNIQLPKINISRVFPKFPVSQCMIAIHEKNSRS